MLKLLLILSFWAVNSFASNLLSYNALKSHLKNNEYSSVEELMGDFPKSFYDNYVLAFSSKSLQEASFLNPRAIVFSEKADFVLTFNGHASQAGFDALEFMEFDNKEKKFNFFEIKRLKKNLEVSKLNPDKCMSCHQRPDVLIDTEVYERDYSPIWEDYSTWPGFYGSDDDRVSSQFEYDQLQLFLSSSMDNSRYQFLNTPGEHFYTPAPDPTDSYIPRFKKNSLAIFTRKLFTLVYERFANRLSQLKNANELAPTIAYYLSWCSQDLKTTGPFSIVNTEPELVSDYQRYIQELDDVHGLLGSYDRRGGKQRDNRVNKLAGRLGFDFSKEISPFDEPPKGSMILVNLMSEIGINLHNWFPNTRGLFDGPGFPADKFNELFKLGLPSLEEFKFDSFYGLATEDCSLIENKMKKYWENPSRVEVVNNWWKRKPIKVDTFLYKTKNNSKIIPKVCLECHSGNQPEGGINFDIPDLTLREKFRDNQAKFSKTVLKAISVQQDGSYYMPMSFSNNKQESTYFSEDYKKFVSFLKEQIDNLN